MFDLQSGWQWYLIYNSCNNSIITYIIYGIFRYIQVVVYLRIIRLWNNEIVWIFRKCFDTGILSDWKLQNKFFGSIFCKRDKFSNLFAFKKSLSGKMGFLSIVSKIKMTDFSRIKLITFCHSGKNWLFQGGTNLINEFLFSLQKFATFSVQFA